MSLLSKSEIQFLQGRKQISKSYEYKLMSIIRKKLANFLNVELDLLAPLIRESNLTKISKCMSPLKATSPASNKAIHHRTRENC